MSIASTLWHPHSTVLCAPEVSSRNLGSCDELQSSKCHGKSLLVGRVVMKCLQAVSHVSHVLHVSHVSHVQAYPRLLNWAFLDYFKEDSVLVSMPLFTDCPAGWSST